MTDKEQPCCPAKQPPISLRDVDIGFKYIEFPEDTFFMESLAQSPEYKPGLAFVPVQRFVNDEEQTHIYQISPTESQARHLAGPILTPDGSPDITVFGSALSDDGILYLCAFNRNSVLALDMKPLDVDNPGQAKCFKEYEGLPSPNDVCTDPKDPKSLYVVAGTFRNLGCVTFSNAAYGQIFRVRLDDKGGYQIEMITDGCKTLAGAEVVGDKLWVAQLFDMFSLVNEYGASPVTEWVGDDADEMVWMADNIDTFDGDCILCPAYTRAPRSTVDRVLKRPWLSSAVLFFVQLASACLSCEPLQEAFRDPEVSLAFSNTYIKDGQNPDPVRLIFIKQDGKAYHFEVDLEETRAKNAPREIKARGVGERFLGNVQAGKSREVMDTVRGSSERQQEIPVLGKRHHFNEQVTHAAHLTDGEQGYIACINFEQPRILLLNDNVFRDHMNGTEVKGEEEA